MRLKCRASVAVLTGCSLFLIVPLSAIAETTFVTIGTGGVTGIYYPTGSAIARLVNKQRQSYGLRCTVESTGGSVFNVNAVLAGDLEFGIVQSDRQYQAWHGLAEWAEKGPAKDLRSVFSIHPEAVTLVAAEDAGVRAVKDLRGKRVNLGNPGSGQRQNAMDALQASGLDWRADLHAEGVKADAAPTLLQDGRIDAFFYTVGHPSGNIKEAAAGRRRVRFIALAGPGIDSLLVRTPYYARALIPVDQYPGVTNEEDVRTFGVKATLVTSARVPDDIVYAVTREVVENLEKFRTLHPAYEGLTREQMLEGLTAPLHPGAAKYFREAGLIE